MDCEGCEVGLHENGVVLPRETYCSNSLVVQASALRGAHNLFTTYGVDAVELEFNDEFMGQYGESGLEVLQTLHW